MIRCEIGRQGRWTSTGYMPIMDSSIVLYDGDDVDKYKEIIKNFKGSTITTTGGVYFHKNALFPRHKLKEIVDNPIVRKLEKAEYVVIGKDTILREIGSCYKQTWYRDSSMKDFWVNYAPTGNKTNKTFYTSWYSKAPEAIPQFGKFVEEISTKKIIFDEDLNAMIPRNLVIKGDLYDKLDKMLGCSDKQSVKVGIEILGNLNYHDFGVEIILLLSKHIENIRGFHACYTVLFKSLLKVVERDYPNWDSMDKLQLLLKSFEKYPMNDRVNSLITKYLNDKHPLSEGSYQLTISEGQLRKKCGLDV